MPIEKEHNTHSVINNDSIKYITHSVINNDNIRSVDHMVICCDNLNKLNIENVLPKNVNIKHIELKVMNNTRNIKPINKCKYITHSVIIYVNILICSIVLISIILYTHYGINYKIITKEDLLKNA